MAYHRPIMDVPMYYTSADRDAVALCTFGHDIMNDLRVLCNAVWTPFQWRGKTYQSAERAYYAAKVEVCFADGPRKRGLIEYMDGNPSHALLRRNVNQAYRAELEGDEETVPDRVVVWENYHDDIMLAILMAKVRSYRDIMSVLVRTRDAILAFVNKRKSWGCGTVNEDAVQRSITQWAHSNPDGDPRTWVPFGNNGITNKLGKLWMRIRDDYMTAARLPRAIIVGDMTIEDVETTLAAIYIWPDGRYQEGLMLTGMLVHHRTQCVIFHFGTNNIPRYHYTDNEFWVLREPKDGAIQTNSQGLITDTFDGHLTLFNRDVWDVTGEPLGLGGISRFWFCVSDILPRHWDINVTKKTKIPQRQYSRAQRWVYRTNEAVRGYEDRIQWLPRLEFMSHPEFESLGMFEAEMPCEVCRGVCKRNHYTADSGILPYTPLNAAGCAALRATYERYLTDLGFGH